MHELELFPENVKIVLATGVISMRRETIALLRLAG
jgi:hypothetical protein